MPVVMTGSPGGPLGGAGGSLFGSGLESVHSVTKNTPELWKRRAEEDKMLKEQRKEGYKELQAKISTSSPEKKAKELAKKTKAKDEFTARQKEWKETEAAEKERLKKWRLESIEKNKVDYHMDMREGEPGYGPTRWCWPTAHKHPRHCASGAADVSVDFVLGPGAVVASGPDVEGDMILVSSTRVFKPQPGESALLNLSATGPDYLKQMQKKDAQKRKEDDAAAKAEAAFEKKEREAAAGKMRAEQRAKALAEKEKAAKLDKEIQKEMKEAAEKAAKDAKAREKIRYEKGKAERDELVRKLKIDTKLRDEDEIANERREGSSMSKGGKDDFVAAAEKGGVEGM